MRILSIVLPKEPVLLIVLALTAFGPSPLAAHAKEQSRLLHGWLQSCAESRRPCAGSAGCVNKDAACPQLPPGQGCGTARTCECSRQPAKSASLGNEDLRLRVCTYLEETRAKATQQNIQLRQALQQQQQHIRQLTNGMEKLVDEIQSLRKQVQTMQNRPHSNYYSLPPYPFPYPLPPLPPYYYHPSSLPSPNPHTQPVSQPMNPYSAPQPLPLRPTSYTPRIPPPSSGYLPPPPPPYQ